MKVEGPKSTGTQKVSKTKRGQKTSTSAFRDELISGVDSVSGRAAVSGAGPLAAIDALLALQEVPDANQGRSKGIKRAEAMLRELEAIQHGLLMGSIPRAKLEALAKAVGEDRGDIADPKLNEILDHIELRAKVELAKLESSA